MSLTFHVVDRGCVLSAIGFDVCGVVTVNEILTLKQANEIVCVSRHFEQAMAIAFLFKQTKSIFFVVV